MIHDDDDDDWTYNKMDTLCSRQKYVTVILC